MPLSPKLVIISPVDPFGAPYGGSLDILERIHWSLPVYQRVYVISPSTQTCVKRIRIGKFNVVQIGLKRSFNLVLALFFSVAIAFKPLFYIPSFERHFGLHATFLFEGLLSLLISPQSLYAAIRSHQLHYRSHNNEGLFHFDRALSETSWWKALVLLLESFRLSFYERIFLRFTCLRVCYITYNEAVSNTLSSTSTSTTVHYAPSKVSDYSHSSKYKILPNSTSQHPILILVAANFLLEENKRAFLKFFDELASSKLSQIVHISIVGMGSSDLKLPSTSIGTSVHGQVSHSRLIQLAGHAHFGLVASLNRAGYKTRISSYVSMECIPLLYGRGAYLNFNDAPFAVLSETLFESDSISRIFEQADQFFSSDIYANYILSNRLEYINFLAL